MFSQGGVRVLTVLSVEGVILLEITELCQA